MRQLHLFALVGLGGALGSLARLGMATFGDPGTVGTFIANIVGCTALGLLARSPRSDQLRWFAATGFSGGLTTMSTFALELVAGAWIGPIWVMVLYFVLSVGVGLAAFSSARSLGVTHPMASVVLGLTGLASLVGLLAGLAAFSDRGLAVAIGFVLAAALGAGVRGVLSAANTFDAQLIAIGLINVVGAFVLAFLTGPPNSVTFPARLSDALSPLDAEPSNGLLILGIGALGAFTTFSTAISQLERLVRERGRAAGVLVGAVMFAAIIGAAALGRSLSGG